MTDLDERIRSELIEPLAQLVAQYEDSTGRMHYDNLMYAIRSLIDSAVLEARIEELTNLRKDYDRMELDPHNDQDTLETVNGNPPFVTWRGWKMIRNRIGDRVKELQLKQQTKGGE